MTLSLGGKVIAEADVDANEPICSRQSDGSRQCRVTFNAPVGTNSFVVTTYDARGGIGHALSAGDLTATIQAGSETNVPITLDGIPASVSASLSPRTIPVGNPANDNVIVEVKDAGGNTIIGPGAYSVPIKLAIVGDPYQSLTLSTTTIESPSQAPPTVRYNGGTNTGSQIVPSLRGVNGTPAAFTATGASMMMTQYYNPVTNIQGNPQDVATFSDGSAAILFEFQKCVGSCTYLSYGIAIADPTTGIRKVFVGDTNDPYNPPAPGSSTGNSVGTVIHGMSVDLLTWEDGTFDSIATDDSGHVYYAGIFASPNDPACSGGLTQSGTIGVLDTRTETTTETMLKGFPGAIKRDTNGNIWWIEDTGFCSTGAGTYFLGQPDSYAIGKLSATTHTVTETTFAQAGLSNLMRPADLSVSPDGAYLYIIDGGNAITRIPTSLSGASAITLANSEPDHIATGLDGTTMWWSEATDGIRASYGYLPGSKTFAAANVAESTFPVDNFPYAGELAYGDGSFWVAGYDPIGAIGRVSRLNGSTPVIQTYLPPIDPISGLNQQITSVSDANGYVWATDVVNNNVDILQYGAPDVNGSFNVLAKRRGSYATGLRAVFQPHRRAHVRNHTPR